MRILIVCWSLFLLPGLWIASMSASENRDIPSHKGLVSDIVLIDEQVFWVSPLGLSKGIGADSKVILSPPFRLLGMDSIRRDDQTELVVVGGEPGVSGMIGFYSVQELVFQSELVADDLIYDVAVSSGEDRIALACSDGRVLLARKDVGGFTEFVERYAHTAPVRSLSFSGDGKHLASAGLDGLVLVASLDGDAEPKALQDHSDKVECVVFSSDSNSVISGARDGRVRVHSVEGRLLRNYSNLGGLNSNSPWERKNQILSLSYLSDPPAIVAGTSLGYIVGLSLTDTSSWSLGKVAFPVNALLVHEKVFVGANRVLTFPVDTLSPVAQ